MMRTAAAVHINVTCLLLLIYSFIRTSSTEFSVWGRTFHVFSFFAIWAWNIQCSYNDCSWWYRCLCQRDHLIRMFAFKLCSWMACHGPHITERDRNWEKKKPEPKEVLKIRLQYHFFCVSHFVTCPVHNIVRFLVDVCFFLFFYLCFLRRVFAVL